MLGFLKKKKEYPIDANEQYAEIEHNFYKTVTPELIRTRIPELWKAMEDNVYQSFEFGRLYTPNEEDSPLKAFLPWIQVGISLLTLFLVFRN